MYHNLLISISTPRLPLHLLSHIYYSIIVQWGEGERGRGRGGEEGGRGGG